MEEQYIAGIESNPYWQYIVIRDTLNPKTKVLTQTTTMNYKRKSATGTQFVFEAVADGSDYLVLQQGLEATENSRILTVAPAPYIDYVKGHLNLLMLGNSAYAQDPEIIQTEFEQYGISFIPNLELASISSTTEIVHSLVTGSLSSNYFVNTTRNFTNTQDKKSSIVAITEMGVFNTDDDMIAYATFPPIIYDSFKHHLSLNLFIKQGEFSSV